MTGKRLASVKTLEELQEFISKKFEEHMSTLVTKDCLENLMEKMQEQNEVIVMQNEKIRDLENKLEVSESSVMVLKNSINLLGKRIDDHEQYTRRTCLRIDGIPLVNKERAEDCYNHVNEVIRKSGVDLPETVLDRAHRIGPIKEVDGEKHQTIIVRFTTWRHRTMLYRKRKSIKDVRIRLDLTKTKLATLLKAQEKAKDNPIVEYVFADVNCRLVCKLANGKFEYFTTLDELDVLLAM